MSKVFEVVLLQKLSLDVIMFEGKPAPEFVEYLPMFGSIDWRMLTLLLELQGSNISLESQVDEILD